MGAENGRRGGVEDVSGLGLVGLTLGILLGFVAGCFWAVPLFPKSKSVEILTAMTTVVVALMTIGGGLGYLMTRRRLASRS
jgi:hypothetical protein